MRVLMYPFTAINLKDKHNKNFKDYLSIVDQFGLTHMLIFTNTEESSYLKLTKLPKGPTFTLKIQEFLLSADLVSNIKNAFSLNKDFFQRPILVVNNFNSEAIPENYKEPLSLLHLTIKSFFPPLNFSSLDFQSARKVILFNLNLNGAEPIIEVRHYRVELQKNSVKKTVNH